MKCPVCSGSTTVKNSKAMVDNIIRRRRCLSCDYRFNTIELDLDMFENLSKKGMMTNVDDSKNSAAVSGTIGHCD